MRVMNSTPHNMLHTVSRCSITPLYLLVISLHCTLLLNHKRGYIYSWYLTPSWLGFIHGRILGIIQFGRYHGTSSEWLLSDTDTLWTSARQLVPKSSIFFSTFFVWILQEHFKKCSGHFIDNSRLLLKLRKVFICYVTYDGLLMILKTHRWWNTFRWNIFVKGFMVNVIKGYTAFFVLCISSSLLKCFLLLLAKPDLLKNWNQGQSKNCWKSFLDLRNWQSWILLNLRREC